MMATTSCYFIPIYHASFVIIIIIFFFMFIIIFHIINNIVFIKNLIDVLFLWVLWR